MVLEKSNGNISKKWKILSDRHEASNEKSRIKITFIL